MVKMVDLDRISDMGVHRVSSNIALITSEEEHTR
jgi:hypothetical protein